MISGSACTTSSHRSNLDCGEAFLSEKTLRFIKECKPDNAIKANLARVQGNMLINYKLNGREPAEVKQDLGIKKYFIAAGAVAVGWWIVVKMFLGKMLKLIF